MIYEYIILRKMQNKLRLEIAFKSFAIWRN